MNLKVSPDILPSAYDLDEINAVPRPLRLRTIQALTLSIGAISIAAALEWPHNRPLVALADLTAISVLCALAAGREWSLRCWRQIRLAETTVAFPIQSARRLNHVARPRLRRRFATAALVVLLAFSVAILTQRFADLTSSEAVQSVELRHPRDDG